MPNAKQLRNTHTHTKTNLQLWPTILADCAQGQ